MNDYRATVIPEGCKPITINRGTVNHPCGKLICPGYSKKEAITGKPFIYLKYFCTLNYFNVLNDCK